MDLSKYLDLFLQEGQEHLASLRDGISGGIFDAGAVQILFRSAHSLKGMAASMGFDTLAGVAHALEDLMNLWQQGGAVEAADQQAAQRAVDLLDALMDRVQTHQSDKGFEPQVAPVLEALKTCAAGRGAPTSEKTPPEEAQTPHPRPTGGAQAETPPGEQPQGEEPASGAGSPGGEKRKPATIRVSVDPGSPLAAARILVVNQRLQQATEVLDMTPPLKDIQKGNVKTVAFRVPQRGDLKELARGLQDLPEIVQVELEVPKAAPDEAAADASLIQSVQVRSTDLDALLAETSQLLYNLNSLEADLPRAERRKHGNWLDSHRALLTRLFDQVLSIRLVSFKRLTDRIERTARDLSDRLGKPLRIEVSGADQQADRSLVEKLLPPITHLIRNAVDHGLEEAQERQAAGKDPVGTLRLQISREAESLLIEFRDDGRGLDLEGIRKKAVERGILSASDASLLDKRRVLELISLPAFSTRTRVSEVSGRGVGMDVVYASVESLGGRLEMDTEKGKGTSFTLVIPSAVTLTQVLTFGWSDEIRFALPTSLVLRLYPLTQYPIVTVGNRKYLQTEEDLVPVLSWGYGPVGREGCGILLAGSHGNRALLVPMVFQSERVIILPLGQPLESIQEWIGGTHLSSGQVAYVLDGRALATKYGEVPEA